MELRLKYPPVPEHAPDLAATCVDAARQISGLELDDSPESLALVDKQMDRFGAEGNSIGKVFKRIDDGPSESLEYFYSVVAGATAHW